MWVKRFSVATAFATFCLLISGGFVSVMEAGMACGFDWPLCQGEYFPRMIDGKEYEHPHRLTAMLVGTMTLGLCALLFKYRRQDRLLTRLGLLAVGLVAVQASLGRLTVRMALPAWVSSTHQATAMAFFCVAVSLAFLTWQRAPGATAPVQTDAERARWRKLILPVALLGYAQVVAGAVMRHTRGGLACGYDLPLCLGTVWPLQGHAGVQAHMVHRLLGMCFGGAVFWLTWKVWKLAPQHRGLKRLSAALCVGVLAQIALGILTVLTSRDLVVMSTHSSLGAALLAGMVSLYWIACPSKAPVAAPAVVPSARPALELA